MAALTVTTPTAAGVAWSPQAVSASDTIAQAAIGPRGAFLIVINGGASSDTVTIVDSSLTPAGNASANLTNAVANGTTEVMFIPSNAYNSATGNITVQHSFTTSVTCVVLALPGF